MCGIVGVAGKITPDLKKVFEQLLVVDQLRGTHSTGVLSVVNHNDKVKITKVLGGPENLQDSKSFNDQFTDFNKLLVGHNRYATQGKVIARNAHPFDFDTLVGVHNGSLRNYNGLPGKDKFSVDSEVLYHSADEIGMEETIKKVTGAYSLVWWDKLENELNFLRNAERPMFMALTEDAESIVFASEVWMLIGICARNNVKIGEAFSTKPDAHIRIKLPTTKTRLSLVVKNDVKGGTDVVYTSVLPFRPNQGQYNYAPAATPAPAPSAQQGAASSVATAPAANNSNAQAATTTQEVDTSIESPLNLKNALFRCGFKSSDGFGAKYVELFRHNDPTKYRLFLKQADYGKYNSDDVVIGSVVGCKAEKGGVIYKINNSTAINQTLKEREEKKTEPSLNNVLSLSDRSRLLTASLERVGKAITEEITEDEVDEFDTATEDLYDDHMGRMYTRDAFIRKYTHCAYCTGNVDPAIGYRFVKDECLCDDCQSNQVILDTVGAQ